MPIPTQDIQAPFDPTGYVSITGAQLLQLIAGATPYVNVGFCLVTTDITGNPQVPNANTNTKWQAYVWIRQSVTSVGVYIWNPTAASDVTYLQWQSVNIAGIGAGSIVNVMIADNTIQDVKIASLSYSKLTGAPSGLTPSGAAGGSLTGNYPNPSLTAGAVVTAAIADLNVTGGKLEAGSQITGVGVDKLKCNGSAKDMQRTNAGATAMEFFTPPVIFTSGIVIPIANALKIPQVNTGATDFQMATPAAIVLAGAISNSFTSPTIVLAAGGLINTAHGLASTPKNVIAVLVNITGEAGFVTNDEVNLSSLGFNPPEQHPVVSFGANATNVYASVSNSAATLQLCHKTTGVPTNVTNANWNVKVYASLI